MTDTLTITDNRTGKTYELPISDGTIRSMDLRQIKVDDGDFGLMAYDPAYKNTASCRSAITFIDGEKGILRYRGYPIEQLAEQSTYLEVAYLLIYGELPTREQLDNWKQQITTHTYVHEFLKTCMEGYRYDAHAMGRLVAFLGTLSTFYTDSKQVRNKEIREQNIIRIIAKMPTIAAWAYRHSLGRPYVYPDNNLSYCGNFLSMLFKIATPTYEPNPVLERALDVLFILHADHEQNCSASAARAVGSSEADPYVCQRFGRYLGGAVGAAARWCEPAACMRDAGAHRGFGRQASKTFVDKVKSGKAGDAKLMGFGHRVYKNYDPRAKVIKKLADQVFEVTGANPKLEIALELERIALSDEYFVSRKLYPNVDFYSGLIYQAMGFPVEMFPVLFAIPRASGWLAQWSEMLDDEEQRSPARVRSTSAPKSAVRPIYERS